jgi:hypothetical protein
VSGNLDHSPDDIIRNLIIDLGDGTAPDDAAAWPVYCRREPDTPENVITVYQAANVLQGKLQTGEAVEHYGAQVRVRAKDYYTGWDKIQNIAASLDGVTPREVEVGDVAGTGSATYTVYAVTRRSGPTHIRDPKQPHQLNLFTFNTIAAIRQSS